MEIKRRNFTSVERYLGKAASRFGRDVPVTIHVDDEVPVQMVISVMDASIRQRLPNVGLGAEEMKP